jgi:hypothetical protein
MSKQIRVTVFGGLTVLLLAGNAFAQNNFVVFDAPDSTTTLANGINTAGAITGFYNRSSGGTFGFIRDAGGTITSFQVPGTTSTTGGRINYWGTVVGAYRDSQNMNHSFLLDTTGNFTLFDPPDSTSSGSVGINDFGEVTGTFGSPHQHGFLRQVDGSFIIFDPPGSTTTVPSSINVHGTIVGAFTDPAGWHAFVRTRAGAITTFDVPGSTTTWAADINGSGTIAGYYFDAGNTVRAFVRDPAGSLTFFLPSRSCYSIAINESGTITFACGNDGFVRRPDGTIKPIVAPPDAECQRVAPEGINRDGIVTGFCLTPSGRSRGFVFTP